MQNKLIEFGIPQDKLVHMPNFVSFQAIKPTYSNKSYLLYSGKLLRTKGLITLLQAVKELPDVNLLIAGAGDMKEELEAYVKDNKIKNVRFLGYLGEEELHKILEESLFVILPTECYENAPMAVLEAFAHGKPVIGADIAGIPEMIKNGETGLLFEPGNKQTLREKIRYFVSHPEMIVEMGKNARNKVEAEYNADLYYQRLMDVYKRTFS